jgi:AbrB family looped-hinge helix DNA binding protein
MLDSSWGGGVTAMPAATLTGKGQIVIPAEIRARYQLTPGTQVELVDDGDGIRLVVRRRIARSDPAKGYGMIRIEPRRRSRGVRRLSDFDPAALLRPRRKRP